MIHETSPLATISPDIWTLWEDDIPTIFPSPFQACATRHSAGLLPPTRPPQRSSAPPEVGLAPRVERVWPGFHVEKGEKGGGT